MGRPQLFLLFATGAIVCACASDQGPAPQVATTLTVFPAAFEVPLNGTSLVSVTAYDAQGNTLPNPILTFRSSNTAIATVSSAGLVSGITLGFDTITVFSGAARATANIAVVTHPSGSAAGTPAVASRPFGIAISATGLVYVSRQDVPYLQVTQLPDTGFADSIRVGLDPTDVAFTSTGATAYVTNQASGTVSVIDVASKQTVDSIATAPYGTPLRVVVGRDDQHFYVSTDSATILEFSTATNAATQGWVLSGPVNGLVFRPDGGILYATSTTGYLFEITPSTGVARYAQIGGAPQDLAVSLTNDELWIADSAGDVQVLQAATAAPIATVTGATGVFGLTMSPDGTRLYASVPSTGQVLIIDRASRSIGNTLSVGGSPRRIAFDRFGTAALIANESGYVSVVK